MPIRLTRHAREVRSRLYDRQQIEIVVDLGDGSVVSVWVTQVM